jgi:hypothetical protein
MSTLSDWATAQVLAGKYGDAMASATPTEATALRAAKAIQDALSTPNPSPVIGPATGGTGSPFFKVAGPTALRTYTFPDADTVIGGGGGGSAPILTVAKVTSGGGGNGGWPATLNISTEGVIDWLFPHAITTNPRLVAAGSLHAKSLGGALANGFDWLLVGQTIFTGASGLIVSNSVFDDLTGAAFSSTNVNFQAIVQNSGVGIGWRMRVPALPSSSRTLRIYGFNSSSEVTCTASLPNSGLANVSVAHDPGAGNSANYIFNVAYRGEGELIVTVTQTINHGSSPNIGFVGATIF